MHSATICYARPAAGKTIAQDGTVKCGETSKDGFIVKTAPPANILRAAAGGLKDALKGK